MLSPDAKIRLLNAQTAAEADVKLYRELLQKAEATLANIKTELSASYEGERYYTVEEIRACRNAIRLAVIRAGSLGLKPMDLHDSCFAWPAWLVDREARRLAGDKNSDIRHNGLRGPAARYCHKPYGEKEQQAG